MSQAAIDANCEDFLAFEDILKQMRKIDDNIVYALNKSIPTSSVVRGDENVPRIRCQELYQQLTSSHQDRDHLIKNCIKHTSDRVEKLSQNNDNSSVSGKLRTERTQLRLLRKELNVEEVIQERSRKIFHEKCRSYYRPS